MRQFKSNVLMNCNDVNEKFTIGEPNIIIVSYSYLDATKGYRADFK